MGNYGAHPLSVFLQVMKVGVISAKFITVHNGCTIFIGQQVKLDTGLAGLPRNYCTFSLTVRRAKELRQTYILRDEEVWQACQG